jgi:hypothetical protein
MLQIGLEVDREVAVIRLNCGSATFDGVRHGKKICAATNSMQPLTV